MTEIQLPQPGSHRSMTEPSLRQEVTDLQVYTYTLVSTSDIARFLHFGRAKKIETFHAPSTEESAHKQKLEPHKTITS